jgi:hypothetical protein
MASATDASSSAGVIHKYNGKDYTPSQLVDHLAQHIEKEKKKYEQHSQGGIAIPVGTNFIGGITLACSIYSFASAACAVGLVGWWAGGLVGLVG